MTWHVVVWILISLAINSMAQPSGRICSVPYRYRLYLSSSPILCAVDAFSAIIRLIAISISFRISPLKACHLVALSRFEVYVGTLKDDAPSTPSAPPSPPPAKPHLGPVNNPWPRYLFFVMGTLPAAIKLASFTGNPWTKFWGLMFPVSFTIIELILLLSRWHGELTYSFATDSYAGALNWNVPAVLGLSWEEWLEPQNRNLHTKTTSLCFWLKILDGVLFSLASITHAIVLVWALKIIWDPVIEVLHMSYALKITSLIITNIILVALIALIVSICVWIGMRCRGYNTKGSFLNRFIGWCFWAFTIWLVISPNADLREDRPPPKRSGWVELNLKVKHAMMANFYLWLAYFISFRMMNWIGRRWPGVTKALLVEQIGWEQVKEPAEQVTSDPLLNNADDRRPEDPVEDVAFLSLFFFLTNLGICLGWYATVYDPTGTVNPAWTDVFGR